MSSKIFVICICVCVCLVFLVSSSKANDQNSNSLLRITRLANNEEAPRIPNSWLVVLNNRSETEQGTGVYFSLTSMGARVHRRFARATFGSEIIHFSIEDETKVYDLAHGKNAFSEENPAASWRNHIAWIQPNYQYRLSDIQPGSAPWGLDRLDQVTTATPTLDGLYSYTKTGNGVSIYVLDTGVNTDNPDFEGRARTVYNALQDGDQGDCNGHGTHVAGIVGSKTYGVAKDVSIRNVKVLGCDGTGSSSTLLSGFEYVLQNGQRPPIVQLSLGGERDPALDNAAETMLQQGYVLIVAAGNENQDACNVSPASSEGVIAVGATDSRDVQAPFSNYGDCVTIFAPGVSIKSLDYQNDFGYAVMSGTSMAAPFVSGIAALILQDNPNQSPAQVKAALLRTADKDKLTLINWPTPNLLVQSPFVDTQELRTTPPRPVDLSSAHSILSMHNWMVSAVCVVASAVALWVMS